MGRIEIDKDNPLYNLIDVVVELGFYNSQADYSKGKKMTIAQLVEAYKELESLEWLKHELEYISKYVKERFKQ